MEQSTTSNQIFLTSWPPNCSSEASASYSLSAASSAIISPACDAQCESSAHTDSSPLKEHDYIGLAEISSSASYSKTEQKAHVYAGNDESDHMVNDEPDLRLGLGPSGAKSAACGDASLLPVGDPPRRDVVVIKDAPTCSNLSIKRQDVKAVQCSGVVDSSAKSTKRPFSDTRVQVIPDIRLAVAGGDEMKSGVVLTSGQLRMVMQMPDVSKHPQMVYWASPPRVSSWHPERAHASGSFGQLGSGKLVKSNPDCATPSGNLVIRNLEPVSDEGPPAKEQVVGWPPIRSYRRSAIAARSSRHLDNECDVQSTIYVKVNMDGIPIGRKVDLNAYSSYEELLSALEGMFQNPHVGEKLPFLHARDFALTYEDKEGDWMLVGDVPWSMFVTTVRRLRIMRGSDPNCLGSSTSKNLS